MVHDTEDRSIGIDTTGAGTWYGMYDYMLSVPCHNPIRRDRYYICRPLGPSLQV